MFDTSTIILKKAGLMYRLILTFRSDNEEYVEHESEHNDISEILEEANDLAFFTTGFELESWENVANFGKEGRLFYYYPIIGNTTTKYVLRFNFLYSNSYEEESQATAG